MNGTVQILICAIDDDIAKIPDVLLPPVEGVGYVVSIQYTDDAFIKQLSDLIPDRDDITVSCIKGRGLSKNRNNALGHSSADILLFADVDNRYSVEGLDIVRDSFRKNEGADIICFSACSYDGSPMKKYPDSSVSYADACRQGYYPSSHEIAIRNRVRTRFDERFGLGSELLCAGEEDVFLKDAVDAGYKVLFTPECIVKTRLDTTGRHFIGNTKLQLTKGAVFRHLFGVKNAIWRSIKEAGWHLVHHGANPFPVLYNMMRGIWTYR